jgi:hypothetical protein
MIKHDIYPFIPKHKNITNINSFFKKGMSGWGVLLLSLKDQIYVYLLHFQVCICSQPLVIIFTILNSYAHSFHILTKSMSQHVMFQDYSLTIFNMP